MMSKKKVLPGALMLLLFCFSCREEKVNREDAIQQSRHRVYKGELTLSADEGLQYILRQQEEVFNHHYDSVTTHFDYKSEGEAIMDFRQKKVAMMVLSRRLNDNETALLRQEEKLFVRELPVAYDAVALIGSKDFDDADLDIEALREYFNPSKSNSPSPDLVFEGQKSGTVQFVLSLLGYSGKASKNVYALKSAQEVIDYVKDNPKVIGFIPYNMISDPSDERIKELTKQIKILSLRAVSKEGKQIRVSANQSDIAAGDYPLTRTITAITLLPHRDNLEALLVSFLSKEKGAKIFLRAGWVPVTIPEREINVNKEWQ